MPDELPTRNWTPDAPGTFHENVVVPDCWPLHAGTGSGLALKLAVAAGGLVEAALWLTVSTIEPTDTVPVRLLVELLAATVRLMVAAPEPDVLSMPIQLTPAWAFHEQPVGVET